jgi:glycosyltransferase involved in cell wall biosynthesis
VRSLPRLSVGLPVYNGERYLAGSLDSLLGQTYENFELIISDNASQDGTADICRDYEKLDSRVTVFHQPRNIGLSPNHNFVVAQAKGELFKWASYDDLYAKELFERCVNALDAYPNVVLAHSWTALIDDVTGTRQALTYPLATSAARAPQRFRSLLNDRGGDDIYGVVRSTVLQRALPHDSYHHSDRTIVAKLSLHGPFHQVPEWLYFRRVHPEQAEQACPTIRSRCANMDPRRANRLRHPVARLYGEYVWAYIAAIRESPLSATERRECYRSLAQWVFHRGGDPLADGPIAAPDAHIADETIVALRERAAW